MLPEEWTGMFVFYNFWAQSIFLTDCIDSSWLYGKVKQAAAYPSSQSGNRNGLYVSAVGLLETIQFNTQGTKTHLVCKDHSLLRYKCMFCTHWSSVPFRALQCTTTWKTRCFSGSGPRPSSGLGLLCTIIVCHRETGTVQMVVWSSV